MTRNSEAEQSTRVGHTKADPTDVYAGRGPGGRDMTETPVGGRGWLGNPYSVEDMSRGESIARFKEAFYSRLDDDEEFQAAVRDLAGKTLGCWCQRLDEDEPPCHAEVIARQADRLAEDVPSIGEAMADLPTRRPLDEGDPCPECGYTFDSDEWDVRHLHGGASLGETWIYECPNCEQETCSVGT